MRRRYVAAASTLAIAAAVGAAGLAVGGAEAPRDRTGEEAVSTAAVERRDVVDREVVTGTLGYADAATLKAGETGVLTRLRPEGAVVRRGGWLYEDDGAKTGWLMYGSRPAWRDFTSGMSDGEDVRQLERNLRALGYDPYEQMSVDGDWDWATTAAVIRFQDARDLTEDGTLTAGELVFRPGAVRMGAADAEIGDAVGSGTPLASISSTRREVKVDLEADRQSIARTGARVTVQLPNRSAIGRIVEVGRVASKGDDDGDATVPVRIRLVGKAGRGAAFDQAPVDVGFERERAKDALTVPVTALVAQVGGGYAVEVLADGRRRLVTVKVGLTADGLAVVEGQLREGTAVVVPS